MLNGKYITLRKVEETDLPVLMQWLTSSDFASALRGSLLTNEAQGRVNSIIDENLNLYGELQYFIVEDKKHELLGLLMFTYINWKDRNLLIEIYLGEEKKRGALYGADAIILATIYAFHHLNVHRVGMYINEFNYNAIGIASKVATYEGRLKKQAFHNGKHWDVLVFGILRDEFEKKLPNALNLGFDYVKTKKYY